ncbi:hypothetical protein C8R45DRAFT_942813 [Mycena sanguinolenta]|nr:hypothetical protein C8R45DRAFT_942813 [Mycena sanguinolenta]
MTTNTKWTMKEELVEWRRGTWMGAKKSYANGKTKIGIRGVAEGREGAQARLENETKVKLGARKGRTRVKENIHATSVFGAEGVVVRKRPLFPYLFDEIRTSFAFHQARKKRYFAHENRSIDDAESVSALHEQFRIEGEVGVRIAAKRNPSSKEGKDPTRRELGQNRRKRRTCPMKNSEREGRKGLESAGPKTVGMGIVMVSKKDSQNKRANEKQHDAQEPLEQNQAARPPEMWKELVCFSSPAHSTREQGLRPRE